ncbi:hypothetical protein QZJ86_12840 [Methylomonas montana]|uniref:DUF6861 domain-containing protein n=1 Tax=Methylomonas montana TaxID=3058963 RepID=UPI00265AE50A|nr:hypothetical protein [Methylomonas montana]WKJ88907.1 hypothetical protein QZJ86_12840 [Methylomonas montana]
MENDPPKNPFDSWHQQRCHPNAPAGGGGPGNFTNAGPLQYIGLDWESLPHPNSPAGRHLTPEEIRKPALTERVQSVVKAYFQALRLAPAAVYQETGYQLGEIIDGLLPGLLQMLAVLGISTVAGAGAGAAVGFFLGGVGAAPGAVIGGELGLEAGTALLTWMGLGFLAVAIGQGMSELTGVLKSAIHHAWYAAEHHHPQFEINRAAQDLAKAVGILVRLILQGLLAYVLKKGAVSSSQAALSTWQTIARGGTRAAADETLAEVSALLRKSKLPDGFVVWIERNWEDLKRNPKLANNKASPAVSSQASSAVTPSELKAMRERQGRDGIGETSGNESKPVAEKTNHEKAAFGERTAHDRMTEKGYEPVGNTDGNYYPGKQGIDGVYKNPSPPPDYIITEVTALKESIVTNLHIDILGV